MKARRYILAVFLWIVALLLLNRVTPLGTWLRAKSLEFQVKSNVDPVKLQEWATNLLAQHMGAHYQDFYGTNSNVPSGLNKVKGFGHIDVEIMQDIDPEKSVVGVFCDSKGGPILVVGKPTLVTPKSISIIPWKPGIYFAGAF